MVRVAIGGAAVTRSGKIGAIAGAPAGNRMDAGTLHGDQLQVDTDREVDAQPKIRTRK